MLMIQDDVILFSLEAIIRSVTVYIPKQANVMDGCTSKLDSDPGGSESEGLPSASTGS